ncbi:hypothetical protein DQ384_16970 [Sphaerisporangium album]|uniref:Uncharacterized protein n=1 Tax=Sphaerisporangium album TaxID=509200 RepID=A0A367FHM8_9ACTN|nr:hypothetical protein [Sphaerisporangium album]RCG29866.1 hypothetical protein DQ384_16970 [Sphaerisporangium album]
MSREAGRHRIGGPVVRVEPRRWDLAKQAAACQVDQMEPAWFVMYGVGIRRFVAIAVWNAPSPLRVEAATVEELRELMREAELGPLAGLNRGWAWVA